MTTYGLTSTGFLAKTLEIIRAEINQEIVDSFGPSVDLANGLLARLVGIISERFASLWELAEAVNSSQNADKATSDALAELCLLTGTFRIEAAYSTIVLTLTGTPTTVVPAASRASSATTKVKFLTKAGATIAAAPAWVASNAYLAGARVTNNTRIYLCTIAGTSAGGGGPTTTATAIVDNTATWRYVGEGAGYVDAIGQSVDKGPIVGAAYDVTTIETPVGGWSNVVNLLDATVGYDDQTDESLRLTREEELSQAGTSTVDAIDAAVRVLSGVTSVTVFENVTDVINVDGMPPHSVEVLVRGGVDADIAAVLLAQVAAGINTTGNTSAVVTDSEGNPQTIYFSRPVEINIGAAITLTYDVTAYPADGDAQVELAVVSWGNAQKSGKNAVPSGILAQVFKVAGVIDVTLVNTSSVAAPGVPPVPSTSTTIAIAQRQLAVYDTAWTTVASSPGTP